MEEFKVGDTVYSKINPGIPYIVLKKFKTVCWVEQKEIIDEAFPDEWYGM